MTDIVERLLDNEQPDVRVWVIRGKAAADEIERLRGDLSQIAMVHYEQLKKKEAEIERLQADITAIKRYG